MKNALLLSKKICHQVSSFCFKQNFLLFVIILWCTNKAWLLEQLAKVWYGLMKAYLTLFIWNTTMLSIFTNISKVIYQQRSIGSEASCKSRDWGSIPGQRGNFSSLGCLHRHLQLQQNNSYKVKFLFNQDVRKSNKNVNYLT